jgi:hypothetical protein
LKFVTADLGQTLLAELSAASRATIAVAYFNPDDPLLAALKRVPQLRVLIAQDFQINNPYKLESLCAKDVWLRAVPVDSEDGKLHSKVFYFQRKDGSRWAMIGSANLTHAGLHQNREACIILDSRCEADHVHLGDINTWLDEICSEDYAEIDFVVAKAVYQARTKYKVIPAEPGGKKGISPQATGYWALKPGWGGEHWQDFLAENVVSIGWGEIGDASTMSKQELDKQYRRVWSDDSDGRVGTNVAQIAKFAQSMGDEDIVLACGRYDSTDAGKRRDVFIYGVARTTRLSGRCFFYDKSSSWYHYKRHATIQKIESALPSKLITSALGKYSFVGTIQSIDHDGFERLTKVLRAKLGVAINV